MNGRARGAWLATGAAGVGCLAVAGAGAGVAMAAGHGATIHGCVAKSNGTLRIVSSAKDCTSHEKSISWDKRGKSGPAGPTGKTGPQGSQGPQGEPGSSGQSTPPATFEMYANVDAEGDLGSNVDAVSVAPLGGTTGYVVTFTKPIGNCAAVAQPGEAGGTDVGEQATSVVHNDGDDGFNVIFETSDDSLVRTPFMMTVTCPT